MNNRFIILTLKRCATGYVACCGSPCLCSDQEIMRQFCVLYLMGGSDFCHDGIPNTSTETLIREYLQSGGPATDFLQHKLNSVCSVLSGRVNKSNASARSLANEREQNSNKVACSKHNHWQSAWRTIIGATVPLRIEWWAYQRATAQPQRRQACVCC